MNGCARLFESERTSLGHIDIIDACQLQTESRAQRSALSKVVKICEKENGKPCVSLGLRVGGGARFELRRRTIPSPSPPSPPSQLGGRVGGAVCRTRPMCATDVLRPAVSRSAAIPSAESSIKSTPLAPTALTPLAMADCRGKIKRGRCPRVAQGAKVHSRSLQRSLGTLATPAVEVARPQWIFLISFALSHARRRCHACCHVLHDAERHAALERRCPQRRLLHGACSISLPFPLQHVLTAAAAHALDRLEKTSQLRRCGSRSRRRATQSPIPSSPVSSTARRLPSPPPRAESSMPSPTSCRPLAR